MKSIFKIIPILLMFVLLMSFVSAGTLSYLGESYSLTGTNFNSITQQDDTYYLTANSVVYSLNSSFEDQTSKYSTAGLSEITAINVTGTTHKLMNKYSSTQIKYGLYGMGSGTFTLNDFTPVGNQATGIKSIDVYDGQTKLRVLDTSNQIYIFDVIPQGLILDLLYSNVIELSNQPNLTNSYMTTTSDKIYIKDGNNIIYSYNYLGDLLDTFTIPVVTNPLDIMVIQDDIYILGSNGVLYVMEVTQEDTNPETFIADGKEYSKTSCITEDLLCTNTTFIETFGDVQLVCDDTDNTQYCSGGCENVANSSGVSEGECTQLGCENECSILGLQTCSTGSTYQICGQYDADACYEYGSVLSCTSNQYCIEDEELGAYCDTFEEGTTYSQNTINVDIELNSNSGVLNSEGSTDITKTSNWVFKVGTFFNKLISAKTIDVSTQLDTIETTFGVGTFDTTTSLSTEYVATSCDYQEEISFQENVIFSTNFEGEYTTNVSGEFEFINSSTNINYSFVEDQNQYIETIIELDESGTYNIKLYDGVTEITDLEIVYNKTSFNIYVTETKNNKILLNSTSVSDDLEEIYLGLKYISNINTLNTEISLIRNVNGVSVNEYYYSLPLAVATDKNPNLISYQGNNNQYKVYQISGVTINDYPIFNKNDDDLKLTTCEYTETGCYLSKVYGNDQAVPTYHFSDVMRVCVSEIKGEYVVSPVIDEENQRSTIENIFNKEWDTKEKILFAVISVFLVFMMFAIVSVTTKDPTPMIFGSILSGLMILYYVIEGFIPVWVLLIFGVLGAMVGTGLVKSGMFRGN